MHGSVDRVLCLHCGQIFARGAIAERIEAANAWFVERGAPATLNPDGDADVGDVSEFVVPDCTVCGGTLKPEVVFFGEFVPRERFEEAARARAARRRAARRGLLARREQRHPPARAGPAARMPIVVVNRGATKGDRVAALKIDAGTTETLSRPRDRTA